MRGADFGETQVVKAEVGGQVRLVMAGETRGGADYVDPFGKTFAPPFVVLGDRVELWKVEGDGADGVLLRFAVFGTDGRHGFAGHPKR